MEKAHTIMEKAHTLLQVTMMEEAALAAGRLLLNIQSKSKKISTHRGDFVTDADQASDNFIQSFLGALFPEILFFTEESGGNKESKKLFVIDPIDGTNNFYYKDDGHFWSVSIAYVEDGFTKIGVIYRPGTGMLFSANCHEDAKAIDKDAMNVTLAVSEEKSLKNARVWSDWLKGDLAIGHRILCKLTDYGILPQLRMSCTIAAMQVALGNIDGFIHPQPQPFDIAAAGLIVSRAGGMVTDLQGRNWTPFSKSIVFTNGHIHKELLSILQ